MDLKGEAVIAAPRERVWEALNDPAVLARCIDGVERLDPAGENRFDGTMNAKVGPVRAKFTGSVTLTEIEPPRRYVIVGEGKGGVAGFAKGEAEVVLSDHPLGDGRTGTHLAYHATSTVGGKLAQLGARLIEGAARGYAESFFAAFKAQVEGSGDAMAATIAADEAEMAPAAESSGMGESLPASESRGLPPLVWGGAVVLAVAAFILWLVA